MFLSHGRMFSFLAWFCSFSWTGKLLFFCLRFDVTNAMASKRSKEGKIQLPVDVRGSKTSVLKFPIVQHGRTGVGWGSILLSFLRFAENVFSFSKIFEYPEFSGKFSRKIFKVPKVILYRTNRLRYRNLEAWFSLAKHRRKHKHKYKTLMSSENEHDTSTSASTRKENF